MMTIFEFYKVMYLLNGSEFEQDNSSGYDKRWDFVKDENKHTSYSNNGYDEGVYLYFDGDVWKFTEKFFKELEEDV